MENQIKEYVRFEMDPEQFKSENLDTLEEMDILGEYELQVEDILTACNNIIDNHIDYEIFENWLWFLKDGLDDNIHMLSRMSVYDSKEVLIPKTKEDLLEQLLELLDEVGYEWAFESDEYIFEGFKEFFEIADYFKFNQLHPESEWKITNYQRSLVQDYYEKKDGNIPKSKRALCKKVIDEGCALGSTRCMHIKGYALYGGDSVYDCDWDGSRDIITKLFEETGDPQYANTLGYIYYYGRCNGGVPEYDKAFQYYSVGAAHDLLESMYKMADMFLEGKGIIKSPQTSDHIIQKLYDNCKPRFCWGEDAKFADIALRQAAHMERHEIYGEAYEYYLQAKYAIDERLKKSDFFGDKKVKDNIEKSLVRVSEKLSSDYFVEELITDFPYELSAFLEGNCKVEIENCGDNSYIMTVKRRKKDGVSRALITIGSINLVTRTRKLVIHVYNPDKIEYKCADKKNMYFDNIRWAENQTIRFCNKDVEVFSISGGEYGVRRLDFM